MGLGKWALEAATTTAILQMSKVFTKNSRNVCSFLFLPLFFLRFGNTLAVKFTHILQTVRHTLQSYGRLMKTHRAWHKKENRDPKVGKKSIIVIIRIIIKRKLRDDDAGIFSFFSSPTREFLSFHTFLSFFYSSQCRAFHSAIQHLYTGAIW